MEVETFAEKRNIDIEEDEAQFKMNSKRYIDEKKLEG